MAAKNYTEILALVNAGNQMGLSNTIKRDYGIPLDFTSVQETYDAAVIYAAENTKAYVGQPLSVGGKLYIINDVAAETKYVIGEKEYDNYLVEVGSATEGDGATIDLENGVLTLHGFEGALSGYLPRKAEDGTLEWVPISAVVQGDGNKVTTLTSTDGSVTIEKTTDTDASLVYDLSVEAYDDSEVKGRLDAVEEAIGEKAEGETEATGIYKAIDDALASAKAYADAQDADTVYDDTELAGRVSAIEADYLKTADKYDDTELTNRVKALEDDRVTEEELAAAVKVESDRAKDAEKALGERIDAIDFIDSDELATELAPYAKSADVESALADKADKDAFDELSSTVSAFLTGDGTEAALDSLKELIAYIDSHDDVDIAGILEDIQAIEGKLAGIDSTVVAYVTDAIDALKIGDYAKAADLTALADRVAVLEAKPFDTYATKSEVEGVDGKFANYTTTETLNGLLADKADADSVVANDTFESFKTENAQAISDARTGAVADVEAKGYAVADEVAQTYATKSDLEDHSNTMATTLNDYAKKADVEADLAKKIETGSIAHTTETVAEGVTVNGTQLDIVVDAYTKAETLAKIEEKITSFTGGESAADVKLALENYEETNDARVGAIETKNGEQDSAIAEAKAQADKGVADAKTANDAIVTINSTLDTHGGDISAVKGRLTTLETAKGDHETRIASAEGKITSLETATANNASAIGTLQGKDNELVEEDARLAGLIDTKANAADVYTKSEIDTTVSGINTEIGKKANAADVYTKGEVDEALANLDQSELEAGIKANADAIAALVGEDTGKSIREIAASEINTLIDAANSEDTITNINTLVTYVNENAGDIAALTADVEANKGKLAGIDTTVVAYVDSAIAAIVLPKASAEITLAEDGTLGIGTVNVNKLSQTEGEELILNGGNA